MKILSFENLSKWHYPDVRNNVEKGSLELMLTGLTKQAFLAVFFSTGRQQLWRIHWNFHYYFQVKNIEIKIEILVHLYFEF